MDWTRLEWRRALLYSGLYIDKSINPLGMNPDNDAMNRVQSDEVWPSLELNFK